MQVQVIRQPEHQTGKPWHAKGGICKFVRVIIVGGFQIFVNMENLNAVFIEQNMSQRERLVKLNQIAIHQMNILESDDNQNRKLLK